MSCRSLPASSPPLWWNQSFTAHWAVLWRSSLLAGLALAATMTAAGEYWGARANAAPELSAKVLYLLRAATLDPIEVRWRLAWAVQIANTPGATLPPLLQLAELRAAAEQLPNSPQVTYALAETLRRLERPGQAAELLPKLKRLAEPGPALAAILEKELTP